jgi:xanthine dehydrogenase YagS FAD-binding subunit
LRKHFPLLTQAIQIDAGAQCGTAGDRLLQRPGCAHFNRLASRCNKRAPGTGCSATSDHATHAILGASGLCQSVQTSDMCVALAALEARVVIDAAGVTRKVPFAQFHRLPGTTPELDTNMQPGEVVTGVELPMPAAAFARHYSYFKIRAGDGSSPVSVAVALDIRLGSIRAARIALGGVAQKPWRAVQTENVLAGARADNALYWDAANAGLQPASRKPEHAFKVELVRQAIVRTLILAVGRREGQETGERQ